MRPRPALTPVLLGIFVGLVVGIADCVLVQLRWARGGGSLEASFDPSLWFVILWIWSTFCGLVGLAFSSRLPGRVRWLALGIAGPGLLLFSRFVPQLKEITAWSAPRVMGLWLAASVLLALPLLFVRVQRQERHVGWLAGLIVSFAGLWWCAMDAGLAAGLPRGDAPVSGPSIVLIFLDTARADDALTAMPHLQDFAGGATRFENAWAPAPWTEPSHRAVLTGVDPWAKDAAATNIIGRFGRAGYHTAAIFANPILRDFAAEANEFTYSRRSRVCKTGIGALLGRIASYGGPAMPVCATMSAAEITHRAQAFIERTKSPYFLVLNYLDAHDPYYAPRDCRAPGFSPVTRNERIAVVAARPGTRQPGQRAKTRVHEQYRAAMRCMDQGLAPLLGLLARDPRAVVAIVGDHGEQFGEHQMGGHGNSVYRQVLHVPLIVKGPGLRAASITEPVSITDLHGLILHEADPSRLKAVPLIDPAQRRPVVSHFAYEGSRRAAGPISAFSLATPEHHLLWWSDHAELFAYIDDPAEEHPLLPERLPLVAQPMVDALRHEQRREKGPTPFDALGYIQ